MEMERYDVIFVRRDGTEPVRVGLVAENVDKLAATQAATQYCHKTELGEGVLIVFHGTQTQVPGSEWWH